MPKSKEIRLRPLTFSATAEMAAASRLWGGYHILTDNDEGLATGTRWPGPKYQAYFKGTAAVAE